MHFAALNPVWDPQFFLFFRCQKTPSPLPFTYCRMLAYGRFDLLGEMCWEREFTGPISKKILSEAFSEWPTRPEP
jgi:hypothetical protein